MNIEKITEGIDIDDTDRTIMMQEVVGSINTCRDEAWHHFKRMEASLIAIDGELRIRVAVPYKDSQAIIDLVPKTDPDEPYWW